MTSIHKGHISRSVTAPHLAQPSVGGEVLVPDKYRQDAKQYVCEQMLLGVSLLDVCRDEMMPSKSVMLGWLGTDQGFKAEYLDALRVRTLMESHRLVAISDGTERKVCIADEYGEIIKEYYIPEDVQRSRLRIDTRFKLLAKLEPTVFGDKMELAHTGNIGLTDMTSAELDRKIRELERTSSE